MGESLGLLLLLVIGFAIAAALLSAIVARDTVRPPRHTAGYAVAHDLAADPAELGLKFEQWTLDLPDGTFLPVWEVRGDADATTAIFVHDWGESRIDVLAALEPWRARCARLVLYDRRGHGESDGGGSRLGDGEEADLLALLDRLSADPQLLVGRGKGADIAIAAAANRKDDGRRLVGVAAMGRRPETRRWLVERLRDAGYPGRPLAGLALGWLRLAGIRPERAERAEHTLPCPLVEADRAETVIERFLGGSGHQPQPASRASISGPS